MTASDSQQSAGAIRAAMLLVLEPTSDAQLVVQPISDLLRQLGLLANSAGDTNDSAGSGGSIALRFGTIDVSLTINDEPAPSSLETETGGSSLAPIWQGVAANPETTTVAWLRLETSIGPDDDRMVSAQRLCALSALLAARLPVTRLCWVPNRLWSDPRSLADAVIGVERLGLPPVMHLIGFVRTTDGSVTTRGLDWFGLEDMRITARGDLAVPDLVRRAARLAAEQLAVRSPLRRGRYPGIERGEWVSVDPADAAAGRPLCHAVIELPLRR